MPEIIIGNHPPTLELIPSVLWFLLRHPSTTLVAGRLFAILHPHIQVIPIDLGKKGKNDLRKFPKLEERLIQKMSMIKTLPPSPSDPIGAMLESLEHDNNILIFPAGASPDEHGNERPWKNGIGKLICAAVSSKMDLDIRFLYTIQWWKHMCSEPMNTYHVLSGKEFQSAAEITTHLRSAFEAFSQQLPHQTLLSHRSRE